MLKITGLYAALLAVLQLVLTLRVVVLRRRLRVGIGFGGQDELARAVRAHGNLTEVLPLALILMAAAETQGLGEPWLHAAGITLFIARHLHAPALSLHPGRSFGRFWGSTLTWLAILGLAGYAIWMALIA